MMKSLVKSPAFTAVAARLGALYLRLVDATSSKTIVGQEHFDNARKAGRGVILTFWHSRLMLAPFVRRDTDAPINMLISTHRDGEMIANAVKGFGIKFIRGSAANVNKPGKTKHGATAVAQMLTALKNGEIVAITPDGPRGPAETFQAGAVKLAQRSGAAIIPAGAAATRMKRLNSWDRFCLAPPFTQIHYFAGEPVTAPADASDDEIRHIRDTIEARLREATRAAEKMAEDARRNAGARQS